MTTATETTAADQTAASSFTIAAGAYREEVAYEPDAQNPSHGMVQTEHGPVQVVVPRGRNEKTLKYPAPAKGPVVERAVAKVRGVLGKGKRGADSEGELGAVAPSELEYCPKWHTDGHPTRWKFPAYLDNPNCRWLQTIKRMYAMELSFPSSLSPEGALLVHSLVRNIRPRVVIETGTFIGMSTMWIAAALQENGDGGVVHTFDDFSPIKKGPWRDVELSEKRLQFVGGLVAQAGLSEHVVFHPGNSSFEMRACHEEFREAGGCQLAFLDADHGIVGVKQDLWAAEPVLSTGGFVLFHDTFPEFCGYDGPRYVMDNVNTIAQGRYEKLDMYLSPINYGLGLMRRVK